MKDVWLVAIASVVVGLILVAIFALIKVDAEETRYRRACYEAGGYPIMMAGSFDELCVDLDHVIDIEMPRND